MSRRRRFTPKRSSRSHQQHYIVPGTDIVLVVENNHIVTVLPKAWVLS